MSRWSHSACALALTASLGCNAIAGINEPVDPPGGSSGTSGGSSGGSSGDANLQRFVGTWRNVKQVTASCGDPEQETPQADLDALAFQITASDSGLVLALVRYPDCRISSAVSGDVATFDADQQCTFQLTAGALQYSYSSASTFTLTSATTAEAHFSATVQVTGGSRTCAYEEGSLYQKE